MGSRGTHGLPTSPLGGSGWAMPWVKALALCLGGAALIWLERAAGCELWRVPSNNSAPRGGDLLALGKAELHEDLPQSWEGAGTVYCLQPFGVCFSLASIQG